MGAHGDDCQDPVYLEATTENSLNNTQTTHLQNSTQMPLHPQNNTLLPHDPENDTLTTHDPLDDALQNNTQTIDGAQNDTVTHNPQDTTLTFDAQSYPLVTYDSENGTMMTRGLLDYTPMTYETPNNTLADSDDTQTTYNMSETTTVETQVEDGVNDNGDGDDDAVLFEVKIVTHVTVLAKVREEKTCIVKVVLDRVR